MLNMLGKCPQCGKPTVSKGMSCDSCLGEAHRPKPKRRAKAIAPIETQMIPQAMPALIEASVMAGDREIRMREVRDEPIVEPPVYSSKPPAEAVPAESMVRNEKGGLKFSKHKVRPSLTPVESSWECSKALTFGCNKYTRDGIDGAENWKLNDPREYVDAFERHVAEWKMGRTVDPESGVHPLGHALASLHFVLWFELQKAKQQ
jgi:hypothetical protein